MSESLEQYYRDRIPDYASQIELLKARVASLERAIDQAVAFADIDTIDWSDPLDQRSGFTMECRSNTVDVTDGAYDDIYKHLREREGKEEAV